MARIELTIFADYHQFYIQDDDDQFGDLSESWTDEATNRLLAVSDRVVGIGTARNSDVAVVLETSDELPELVPDQWDRINKTAIECATGRLVVAGCTDYFPDAFRLEVEPGTYDLLIGYRNLDADSPNALEGDDSYHLFIARQQV
ncbi:MAG: hypothetical protein AAFM91_07910 [Pseudomonadota bacterium]